MTTLIQAKPMPKWQTYATYALMGLLTLVFLGAGVSKLLGSEQLVQDFTNMSIPLWFMYVTGLIEVGSVVLMWIPKTRLLGALGLVATMVGAVFVHIMAAEFAVLVVPVIFLVLAGIVAWTNRPVFRNEI